jgi:hypothetical protein
MANQPQAETQVTLTSSEFEALQHLVQTALEADVVREPYPDTVKAVLGKLALLEAGERGSFAAEVFDAFEETPVKAQ